MRRGRKATGLSTRVSRVAEGGDNSIFVSMYPPIFGCEGGRFCFTHLEEEVGLTELDCGLDIEDSFNKSQTGFDHQSEVAWDLVWDALRSERPYRKAWTDEAARTYIREQAGKHFDPEVVEAFFKLGS